MIDLICIMLLIVFAIFGWCMIISSKRRDKAWKKTMKGKTTTPKTNDADKRSENVGGKEKEGSQIYKSDLY